MPQSSRSQMPIHFLTIVLNGEPFIRYHLDVFKSLPFDWRWHIVEGVADLKLDTAWSVPLGGRVSESMHRDGLSRDGTRQYLDELAQAHPDKVRIYRKGNGGYFHGKLEMVNAPLAEIERDLQGAEALLWQVDVDEFWTAPTIEAVRRLFLSRPEAMGAFFHCHYFVAPRKFITSMDTWATYAESWLRVWRFRPGMLFSAHEPPTLVDQEGCDLARHFPLTRDETLRRGLVFQHFSYVLESQVLFKEIYYGFSGAVDRWRRLKASKGRVRVGDYLPWAGPDAMAEDWTPRMGRPLFPFKGMAEASVLDVSGVGSGRGTAEAGRHAS